MKKYLTHNVHFKSMDDVMRHLEVEEERLHFTKLGTQVYMVDSISQDGKETTRKHQGRNHQAKENPKVNKKQKKGRARVLFKKKKKNIIKVKCFNCGNNGHFVRDCTEPKKVKGILTLVYIVNVFSYVSLTETNPFFFL